MHPPLDNNPIRHTHKIKAQMRQTIQHLREDIGNVTAAKAQALFQTSAEVLTGLVKAFEDFERQTEATWRIVPRAALPKERTPHASRRSVPLHGQTKTRRLRTSKRARRRTVSA
jgi:hypothetical protein